MQCRFNHSLRHYTSVQCTSGINCKRMSECLVTGVSYSFLFRDYTTDVQHGRLRWVAGGHHLIYLHLFTISTMMSYQHTSQLFQKTEWRNTQRRSMKDARVAILTPPMSLYPSPCNYHWSLSVDSTMICMLHCPPFKGF